MTKVREYFSSYPNVLHVNMEEHIVYAIFSAHSPLKGAFPKVDAARRRRKGQVRNIFNFIFSLDLSSNPFNGKGKMSYKEAIFRP